MKKVAFIGQAPAKPGSKNEVAGSYLMPWLLQIGLDTDAIKEYLRFYALTDTFPGAIKAGHLPPTTEQVKEHRPKLIKELQDFQPDILVPVGAMAIMEVIPKASGKLNDIIGSSYTVNPYNALKDSILAIPLPHPSGRSTWVNQHSDLLVHALTKLGAAIQD